MRFLLIGSFAMSLLKFRRNLIEALMARGWDVHVVLPFGEDERWVRTKLESLGVIVH